MTPDEQRPMCFNLRALPGGDEGERWQWTVYSHPDLTFLRDGQIAGDREKAERAARAAVSLMGGIVNISREA